MNKLSEMQLTDETLAIMTPVYARELCITTTTQTKVKKRSTHIRMSQLTYCYDNRYLPHIYVKKDQ